MKTGNGFSGEEHKGCSWWEEAGSAVVKAVYRALCFQAMFANPSGSASDVPFANIYVSRFPLLRYFGSGCWLSFIHELCVFLCAWPNICFLLFIICSPYVAVGNLQSSVLLKTSVLGNWRQSWVPPVALHIKQLQIKGICWRESRNGHEMVNTARKRGRRDHEVRQQPESILDKWVFMGKK